MSKPRTILAFDFGLRRIGAAVGQDVTASASPVGVVANGSAGADRDAIAALIAEWQPDVLVVGMPFNADGSTSAMQSAVERFIEDLQPFRLPIDTVDERYTSMEAASALKNARAAGSRGQISKASIDSAAAVFIAERYLSSG